MFLKNKPKKQLTPEEQLKKLNEQFERKRVLTGPIALFTTAAAVCMSIFHLWSAGIKMLPTAQHKAIHLAFALLLTFIIYPATSRDRKKVPIYDIIFSVLGAASCIYILVEYQDLIYRSGAPNKLDIIMGGILIILIMEATRRTMGWPLVIVSGIFLAYAMFGQYIPGTLGHKGYSLTRVIEHMYLTGEGIFGVAIYVTATFVFLFLLLGSFLNETGGAQSFIDLAFSLTGKYRGGPAKAAIVASGAMGMVSGSSFANVAGTGVFTIPLMKSVGYKPEFAGGVEAAASSGGQIMPPIMGAAAFIMAEMTGIPYGKIILHAALPAVLYYIAVFFMVDLEAAKLGLSGLRADQLPTFKESFKKGAFLLFAPLSIIVMLILGYSPIKASYISVLMVIVFSMFRKETRLNLQKFLKALEGGAKGALDLVAACAVAGLIVGTVTLTGLGLKFADFIIALSSGNMYFALILTMLASIFMGMGMPTTALYIILGAMVAPALVKMGVPLIAAHLFIFYFGCFASVTPPVALSSYLAASIAKANAVKTALMGLKLSITAFILPYIFVFSPAMLLMDSTIGKTIGVTITSIIGVYALSCSLERYMLTKIRIWESIILFSASIMMIYPGIITDVIGIGLIGIVVLLQFINKKKGTDLAAMGVEE
ncbi:MAG: TRAP transporter permease [Clostridiales bacterium]|nr:TRAP transporter permease [Clostridiales bacterium]